VNRRAFALFEAAAQGYKDVIDGRWLALPEHRERIAKLLRSFDR
jgi:hypothetical protein